MKAETPQGLNIRKSSKIFIQREFLKSKQDHEMNEKFENKESFLMQNKMEEQLRKITTLERKIIVERNSITRKSNEFRSSEVSNNEKIRKKLNNFKKGKISRTPKLSKNADSGRKTKEKNVRNSRRINEEKKNYFSQKRYFDQAQKKKNKLQTAEISLSPNISHEVKMLGKRTESRFVNRKLKHEKEVKKIIFDKSGTSSSMVEKKSLTIERSRSPVIVSPFALDTIKKIAENSKRVKLFISSKIFSF